MSDSERGHGTWIGVSLPRRDAAEKLHGRARYCDDYRPPGLLHAALVTSPHAHARIRRIETGPALALPGVRGVFCGGDFPVRIGIYLGDRPPLAREVVRHFGEPVAAVVADSEAVAREAAFRVEVDYEPLPAVDSVAEALKPGAPLVHPDMAAYDHIQAILPEPGSNVAHRTRIRKGDPAAGFRQADTVVENTFRFPSGDHAAMEPRAAFAEILPDGRVLVRSSTQSPFVVRALLARHFSIPVGRITVVAPAVGGGFGGKAGIQLEALAYLLSRRLAGRPVRLANSREEDMAASPGRPGLEAHVKLGAARDGRFTAAEILFLFDTGGYADYAVNVSRAAGYACTGPYRIPNVHADSACVYTNRPFATAYRGFGHIELAFAMERAVDLLADAMGTDPVRLRLINAVLPGDTTPSRQVLDGSTGNLPACIKRVAERLEWEEGARIQQPDGTVRAKSVSCFWKAPAVPPNADAGAILSFNDDGSVNLITGVVEIGEAAQTGLAQIVAERLGLAPEKVHVVREVMTDRSPHDWTTAASRSLFMAGRAALDACDDAAARIRELAAEVLGCSAGELEVAAGRVFLRDDPQRGLELSEVALGYSYPDGRSIGGPVIGTGRYIAHNLTGIDPQTGEGRPGLEWTLGAEGVEVELSPREGAYRVLRAACCMDVGRVINPGLARGQVVGAMAMALGFAASEAFAFDARGRLLNGSLRNFKIPRFGDHPRYFVDFLETPQADGPYGARGLGEQGVLGIPSALAGALSRAAGVQLNQLPLTREAVWRALREGQEADHDPGNG
ncbi:MAG: xanthine dehydrogenase family protein molybdopterin-binding subunit [Spirochaetales bacterium]|nr:xanthine dehydrogenase family protein molybdopterin-binding subunit [Spirochaetales bacterium]